MCKLREIRKTTTRKTNKLITRCFDHYYRNYNRRRRQQKHPTKKLNFYTTQQILRFALQLFCFVLLSNFLNKYMYFPVEILFTIFSFICQNSWNNCSFFEKHSFTLIVFPFAFYFIIITLYRWFGFENGF